MLNLEDPNLIWFALKTVYFPNSGDKTLKIVWKEGGRTKIKLTPETIKFIVTVHYTMYNECIVHTEKNSMISYRNLLDKPEKEFVQHQGSEYWIIILIRRQEHNHQPTLISLYSILNSIQLKIYTGLPTKDETVKTISRLN